MVVLRNGYRRHSRVRTRARQLLSVVQVIAIALATLVLLPLVVQAQEDDPFNFQEPGERTFRCEFTGQSVLIESTVFCKMRVANGAAVDASMFMFVNRDSIRVSRCPDRGAPGPQDDFDAKGNCLNGAKRIFVARSDPDFDRFVGAWAISLRTKPVVTRSVPTDRDVRYDPRHVETCEPRGFEEYDGGPGRTDFSQMCSMGVVRGARTTRWVADSGEPTYERQYFVGMSLRDDGTDQTAFRAWDLHFDFVVRAKIPADDTCPSARVNGACSTAVYTRA